MKVVHPDYGQPFSLEVTFNYLLLMAAAAKLADEHGHKMLVNYHIHDASKVIIRRMNGSYLCETSGMATSTRPSR